MARTMNTGNSGILLLIILLGIILLGGTLLVISSSKDQEVVGTGDITAGNADSTIVDQISDPALSPDKGDMEREEQPIQIKTVDSQGHFMYIQNEPVKVYMPGKGVKKARMVIKDTGERVLPVPEAVKTGKLSKKLTLHPAVGRKKGGKVRAADKDKTKTEQPTQGGNNKSDGAKGVEGGG
jgi:hypothetical protein